MTDATHAPEEQSGYCVVGVTPMLRFRLADKNGAVLRWETPRQAVTVARLHTKLFGYRTEVQPWHSRLARYVDMAYQPVNN